jgi:hypothetical protein
MSSCMNQWDRAYRRNNTRSDVIGWEKKDEINAVFDPNV